MSYFNTLTESKLRFSFTHAFLTFIFSGPWLDDTEKFTSFDGRVLDVDITFDISNFWLIPQDLAVLQALM